MAFQQSADAKAILRTLWKVHVKMTRTVILGIVRGEDVTVVEAELMKNQDDIGNVFRSTYGDAVAKKIANLLKEHIRIAGMLITAAKNHEVGVFALQRKLWWKNADDIAMALSTLNSVWHYENLKAALHAHLTLTLQEAINELKGNRSGGIRYYLEAMRQVQQIADALSLGILQTIALHGQHIMMMFS